MSSNITSLEIFLRANSIKHDMESQQKEETVTHIKPLGQYRGYTKGLSILTILPAQGNDFLIHVVQYLPKTSMRVRHTLSTQPY
jgi:hypothetical protein